MRAVLRALAFGKKLRWICVWSGKIHRKLTSAHTPPRSKNSAHIELVLLREWYIFYFFVLVVAPCNCFIGVPVAFVSGAVVGVLLMGFARKKIQDRVPFAPFLITGLFVAFFYGQPLIDWYQNLLIV